MCMASKPARSRERLESVSYLRVWDSISLLAALHIGGLVEWPMALVLKTRVGNTTVGSNPTSTAQLMEVEPQRSRRR